MSLLKLEAYVNFYFHLGIRNTFSQLYCVASVVAHGLSSGHYEGRKHIESLSGIWSMECLHLGVLNIFMFSYLLVV